MPHDGEEYTSFHDKQPPFGAERRGMSVRDATASFHDREFCWNTLKPCYLQLYVNAPQVCNAHGHKPADGVDQTQARGFPRLAGTDLHN